MTGGARSDDPISSKVAAALVPVDKLRQMYLDALRSGPKTTLEIARLYGIDRDSFSPRTPGLLDLGWITWVGVKVHPNEGGNLRPFNRYGLRDPNDPDPVRRPPKRSQKQRAEILHQALCDVLVECSRRPAVDIGTIKRVVNEALSKTAT